MSTSTRAVFLSYASQDVEAARRICDALRAVGLDVWFDQSALRGGDAWDASIRRQIKECALFVPVISANTQAREEGYFRREWNLAVNRTLDMADDKAFLLPVVIDATVDVNARVPEKFREVQWTHAPAGEALASFAERVQRLMSGRAASATPVAPSPMAPATAPAAAEPADEAPSIAVLPFVNRSRDEDDEYFSDGLADELLSVLAKIRGLRVAARTSAFQFKGKSDDIAMIGRKLNVTTVLEGSVRKAGNRMRISVQLVKVADGYHLWSETYNRTLEDIFKVQDDIAQSVVKELRTTLLGGAADATAQVAAAVKGRADNPEAHRLYLQGRFFLERVTEADVARAVEYLDQATALDPEFALGWPGLARACHLQARGDGHRLPRDSSVHAKPPNGRWPSPPISPRHTSASAWFWSAATGTWLQPTPNSGAPSSSLPATWMSSKRVLASPASSAVATRRSNFCRKPLRSIRWARPPCVHLGRLTQASADWTKRTRCFARRSISIPTWVWCTASSPASD